MQNGFLKQRTKGEASLSLPPTNGHSRIHSESETSLNSSFQSLGPNPSQSYSSSTLPHSHTHSHPPHSHESGGGLTPNNTRTLNHTPLSVSSHQETRVSQIIRELQLHEMGSSGEMGLNVEGNSGDYVTSSRPPPHPIPNNGDYGGGGGGGYGGRVSLEEHYGSSIGTPYDNETLLAHQEAYYGRAHPDIPLDYSHAGGGYQPTGYEELDYGMIPQRPEYLNAMSNPHPGSYGELSEEEMMLSSSRGANNGVGSSGEFRPSSSHWLPPPNGTLRPNLGGGGMSSTSHYEMGGGGGGGVSSSALHYEMGGGGGGGGGGVSSSTSHYEMGGGGGVSSSTSHYGNLPVRPYLLASGSGTTVGALGGGGGGGSEGVESGRSSGETPPHPHTHSSSAIGGLHYHQMMGDEMSLTHSPGPSSNNTQEMRWRNPDLHEVIQFLGNVSPVVKANAAAYLQHLSYMDDTVKTKTRALGGIPPLVALLAHEAPEVHRSACGALRNLSYGRQNDENKKSIKSAGGIPSLVRLLKRTTENEVRELVTGVLWNLSSCEELKKAIIDDAVVPLVSVVIVPHSGWDRANMGGGAGNHIPDACWSTVFKNASGIFRNVSSAGEYGRKKLRETEGLVESLLHVIRSPLLPTDIDDKSVENCVCVLRNLSFRCQEVEDPHYDKHPPPPPLPPSRSSAGGGGGGKGENLGCFGANKKKKESGGGGGGSGGGGGGATPPPQPSKESGGRGGRGGEGVRGMELLWQPEVVQAYLPLLSNCSNPETLEAAAGAIQNLAACYWQPSIEIRAAVRKEKGLPLLVELLRMEVDRVVCAVATALRNLAIDQRNKELIGKYAMRDLVQKLPSGRPHDQGTSDDTIAAVLATLNEVIKKNAEFSRSLLEAEGVERLVYLTQQKRRFSQRVVKFASQVLYSLWQHQELREVYKKGGWSESDFVSKGSGGSNSGGRSGSPSGGGGGSGPDLSSAGSPINPNSTLNRPMASQGGTRYEDKTLHRGGGGGTTSTNPTSSLKSPPPSYPTHQTQNEEIPLADMPYPDGSHPRPPPGAFRMYPSPPVKPGEPLYAQVNREKKKNRGFENTSTSTTKLLNRGGYGGGGVYSNSTPTPPETTHTVWKESTNSISHSVDNLAHQPAGDSWV